MVGRIVAPACQHRLHREQHRLAEGHLAPQACAHAARVAQGLAAVMPGICAAAAATGERPICVRCALEPRAVGMHGVANLSYNAI